jgi:hypothetical protein
MVAEPVPGRAARNRSAVTIRDRPPPPRNDGLFVTGLKGSRMSKEWRFLLMTLILIAILAGGTFLLFYFGSPGA